MENATQTVIAGVPTPTLSDEEMQKQLQHGLNVYAANYYAEHGKKPAWTSVIPYPEDRNKWLVVANPSKEFYDHTLPESNNRNSTLVGDANGFDRWLEGMYRGTTSQTVAILHGIIVASGYWHHGYFTTYQALRFQSGIFVTLTISRYDNEYFHDGSYKKFPTWKAYAWAEPHLKEYSKVCGMGDIPTEAALDWSKTYCQLSADAIVSNSYF